ncbi:MAG: glycosyltransferase family 2 protein [Gammaproteobacteria bacterium]|jgi:hypothetical protein|nr:glycosyltransferase family 2 protein [Gammaproteobacteria bacterium]
MARPRLTVISHFWNNRWILEHWLRHHRRLFDHGILIDHGASDGSAELIRDLAPGWEIRPTWLCREHYLSAQADQEVMSVERELEGWKMVLNVTEFLVIADLHAYVAALPDWVKGVTTNGVVLVDRPEQVGQVVTRIPFFLERTYGYFEYELGKRPSDYGFPAVWRSRLLHRHHHGDYEVGRHVSAAPHVFDPALYLAWAGWAPFADIRAMKMSVQARIPDAEFERGIALQHRLESTAELERRLGIMQDMSHELSSDSGYQGALAAVAALPAEPVSRGFWGRTKGAIRRCLTGLWAEARL